MGIKERAETFLDSETKATTITKVILAVTAMGGLLVVSAMAPNTLQLIAVHKRLKHYSQKQIRTAYHNLKSRGLIEIRTSKKGQAFITLTKKGEGRLAELELDQIVIKKPKKWDGKWRVFMFDLPIQFNKVREALRWKIKDLGFAQVQKSVWIYPYPCEEELIFVTEFFAITKYVEILTVEKISRAEKLEQDFNLH